MIAVAATPAFSQDTGILNSGDLAVTGFSGTQPSADGTIDKTYIDENGGSLKVFDVGSRGAPRGQLLNVEPKFQAYARDIGQVFGVALDNAPAPNIYVTATSAYGIQIVGADADGDGIPDRIRVGQPDAQFMPGQFGVNLGGGPGSIFKVDGMTGEVSLFANVDSDGQPNSGPGLGNIAFDPTHYQLFVSDLDTGVIHRLDMGGNVLDTFDHGSQGRPTAGLPAVANDPTKVMDITAPTFDAENPDTWGLADSQRRVWGLAYHRGRLYYGVDDGQQIWSVDIASDGSFGGDARVEIENVPGGFPISDILFTPRGRMVAAQRGGILGSYDYTQFHMPNANRVVRYRKDQDGNWIQEADEYAIGFPVDHQNASGGVGLACGNQLWSTGDSLRDNPELADRLAAGGEAIVHGLQGNKLSLVRPRNVPPWSSHFVDYDGQFADPEKAGHVGDVEVYRKCEGRAESWPGWTPGWTPPPGWFPPPWWPRTPDLEIEKSDARCFIDRVGGQSYYVCTFTITVSNVGAATFIGKLNVVDNVPANVEFLPPPGGSIPWDCVQPGGPGTPVFCESQNVENLLPGESETLTLTVRRNVNHQQQTMRNCVLVDHPNDPYWNNEDCGRGYGPGPDLEIEKTLDRCLRLNQGTVCFFWLDVTNVGAAVYNGPLHIVENMPAGATFQGMTGSSLPGWNCWAINPGEVNCTHPGAVTMWPGDTHWVRIAIFVPIANGGSLENCIELGNPEHNNDPNFNGNNRSCVPFDVPGRYPTPIKHQCPAGWQEVPASGAPAGWLVMAIDGINPDGTKWGLMCMKPRPQKPQPQPVPQPDLPQCRAGETKFFSQGAVPQGWAWRRVTKNGQTIYCAKPRQVVLHCPSGWQKFPAWNAVPQGWLRQRIVRGNRAIICGKPRPIILQCPKGWQKFPSMGAVPQGWQRRRIVRGNRTIICGKPRPIILQCPKGWQKFGSMGAVPKGWQRRRIVRGNRTIICGKPRAVSLQCPKGWKKFGSMGAIPKGWQRRRIVRGNRTIYCGKRKRTIICQSGYVVRNGKCVRISTTPTPTPGKVIKCKRGFRKVGNRCVRIVIKCRVGQKLVNGKCRTVGIIKNPVPTITLKPKCPKGFRFRGGKCRKDLLQ